METKDSLKLDQYHRPMVTATDGIEILYQSRQLDNVEFVDSEDIRKFNFHCDDLDMLKIKTLPEIDMLHRSFHAHLQEQWFMPEHYKTLDVEEYVRGLVPTSGDSGGPVKARVEMELAEYKARNLFPVLRSIIYIINTLRKHNLVWGVGRGSSVASYVLYLIGVHKVNSLKYNLDIREFLKDE